MGTLPRFGRPQWHLHGLAGICLAIACLASPAAADQPAPASSQLLPVADSATDLERISNGFSQIVERVKPAVVSIRSIAVNEEMNAELRRMFGDKDFQPIPISGTGSGVIIDKSGFIVTNNHVVEDAEVVQVTLADGREFRASVIGTDKMTDLAVIKIDAPGLTACRFGDSETVKAGHLVLAIGSPFKFGHSVSHGIISAVGRSNVDVEIDYKNWLQTDAPINPGNSGGPLINTRGEIIGISVAIATESGGYQGVGFAIPSNVVARVTETLKRGQKMVRGYLGVVIRPVNQTVAEVYGLSDAQGAMLETIGTDSPAAKAGLKPEDIILAIDGRSVRSLEELQERVALMPPGTRTTFKVWREKSPRDVSVQIGEQPENFRTQGDRRDLIRRDREPPREMEPVDKPTGTSRTPDTDSGAEYFERIGLHAASLTAEVRRMYLIPDTIDSGVVVTAVNPLGEGYNADLRRRCVIRRMNDQPVTNLSDFKRILNSMKDSKGARIQFQLDDESFFTVLKLR